MDPKIFKAYDVRGIYPEELDEETYYQTGLAYAKLLKPKTVAVGKDVRPNGESLKKELIRGLTESGVNVIDIENISTDMLYFAVGHYGYDGGITVTASHNPAEYNGMKMVKKDAVPLFGENGMFEIRDMVQAGLSKPEGVTTGQIETKNIWDDYVDFILKFINPKNIKPIKIAFNANFGYGGKVFERIIQRENLPIELIPLNFEPDGSFPKGRPDPFVPENRTEFIELCKNSEADFGVALDADADRCFFCDGSGEFFEPYFSTTILIENLLKKNPESKIIYDVRYTWALIEAVKNNGGTPLICRVGHSYIKDMMRKENAIFCGESSGHYYFKDFFYCDNGMIPALLILEEISTRGQGLSEILKPYTSKYFVSGEYNTEVESVEDKLKELKKKYNDGKISELDKLSVEYEDWRFNVRPSNTEPLLRLNLEAKSQSLMEKKRDELLKIIKGD